MVETTAYLDAAYVSLPPFKYGVIFVSDFL